jgi:DtxR family manganese transport transcriptional regulator
VAADSAEDYVEAVSEIIAENGRCRAVDLANRFDVSHVTVAKIIARLVKEGLVGTKPHGPISLTPRGKRLAEKTRRRHETVYRFLLAIGVSKKNAAIDAEGIEHHLSSETLQRLRDITDRPTSG